MSAIRQRRTDGGFPTASKETSTFRTTRIERDARRPHHGAPLVNPLFAYLIRALLQIFIVQELTICVNPDVWEQRYPWQQEYGYSMNLDVSPQCVGEFRLAPPLVGGIGI
jgi:hypothetical protein